MPATLPELLYRYWNIWASFFSRKKPTKWQSCQIYWNKYLVNSTSNSVVACIYSETYQLRLYFRTLVIICWVILVLILIINDWMFYSGCSLMCTQASVGHSMGPKAILWFSWQAMSNLQHSLWNTYQNRYLQQGRLTVLPSSSPYGCVLMINIYHLIVTLLFDV